MHRYRSPVLWIMALVLYKRSLSEQHWTGEERLASTPGRDLFIVNRKPLVVSAGVELTHRPE